MRRLVVLGVVLALTALVVPPSAVREAPMSLVKVQSVHGIDHKRDVLWILTLGSDARPGQSVVRSRADAIQLVGVNLKTGAATAIGIPRDSYVNVPGHGRNKINSSMFFGGPQLMAQSVAGMVGIRPDYVFTTGFEGFRAMIEAIGGITVRSKFRFFDVVKPGGYKVGKNRLNGMQALIFSRIRKSFPNGDFDRSANQQRTLLGILREVRSKADRPGFMERAVLSVTKNMDTNLRPSELFVLAQGLTQVQPGKFTGCVIQGSTGYAGAASVVYPDIGQARSIAHRARKDATLEGRC
ncbi:MAG TPA: LCP family protein [Nocardioidaceae bacterium]|nr:LCP family protein [Nocardioidaceae bacterium]